MQAPFNISCRHCGILIAALVAWLAIPTAMPAANEPPAVSQPPAANQPPSTTKPPAVQPPPNKTGDVAPAERERWRKELLRSPRPTTGCYTATYPERQWREVPCKTPPNKPYLPRERATSQPELVGGSGTDLAVATDQITQAEGSFDSVTGVTVTPAYSLQLNTDFFPTKTCDVSPNAGCRGWEQFIYESSGTGFIQYWLINFGPAGTVCPVPRSTQCTGTGVFNDGWCPFTVGTSANPVYCAVNAVSAAPAPPKPATSLGEMRVNGAAAGVNGAASDAIVVTVGGAPFAAPGNNYFPDLGSQWREAEFNVFGNCCNSQALFNAGASAQVRIELINGTNLRPSCDLRSFTGESNNLVLFNVSPTASSTSLAALVFAQGNPALPGLTANCNNAASMGDSEVFDIDPVIAEMIAETSAQAGIFSILLGPR